jgi:DNA invertase Pin-like site-specific DNA recombinase
VTRIIEADSLEQAEAMNPFWKVKPRKKRTNAEKVLSDADVRAILASPGTYIELARQFNVSCTTISKVKRREIWRDVVFDGEIAKSSSPRGRKPKGTL